MRILKKSLACLLVAIIAATAMFGCLVSADTVTSYEGSLYVYGNPESINLGSTDNVTFNVKVDNGEAVNPVAALVTIASELGKVTAVTVADHDGAIFTGEDLDVKIDENGVATVLIESSSLSEGYAWSYAVLDVTVAPNADLALGDYKTTVSAVSETVGGATYDEIPIVYSSDFVTVSVVEPLGSASNPYVLNGNRFPPMKATYVTIAAGETIYVKAYGFAGYEVGAEFDCEISVETLTAAEELFTVTNTSGADVVDGLVKVLDPIGAMENPEVITAGDHTATVVEGSQGYYYTYTATADGTVKVTMPTDKGWAYVINNMTTYVYGDTQWSDSDPVVNPGTVEVAEGDVLEIMVNTYDPASPWTAPAGEINWNLTLEEAVTGPEVDPALVFSGASLGFGTSSLQINFRVANTVLALYDDMEIVIIPEKYDTTTMNYLEPKEVVISKANLAAAGSKNKSYLFTDIELHELGLNIDYMLRAYDANDNLVAVSEVFTTSAASYLKNLFPSQTKATFRTLITDTLVVGYEAVARMAVSFPNSDLAKDLEENGSIIDGFDISEATQTIDSYNTVNEFNSYNSNYKTTSSTHQVRISAGIGKVPYITYRIKDSNGALDLSKLSFKVSYTATDSKDATATVPFNQTYTTANGDISLINGWVNFKFYDISLADGDKDLFVEAYYDGEKVFDTTYSVETYLGSKLTDANIGALSAACIKLGISFRANSVS